MIKTSVIIPVYNTEKYLDKCLDSVIKQSQKEIEIIIVDDGSTDSSLKILREYEEQYDYITVIRQQNHKLGAARNSGVLASKGEYIYFLDSDDYIDSKLLERCYEVAVKDNLDFVMFDSNVYMEDNFDESFAKSEIYDRSNLNIGNGIYTGKEYWKRYYEQGGVYTNAYLVYIKKKFFIDHNLFFLPEIFYEDNDWCIRLYASAERVKYIPDMLYYRLIRQGSIMFSAYSQIHLDSILIQVKQHLQMYNSIDEYMVNPRIIGMISRTVAILESIGSDKIDVELVDDIYDISSRLFMEKQIKDISARAHILRLLKRLEENVTDKSKLEYINTVKKEVIEIIYHDYSLDKNIRIGIYGKGKVSNSFLDLYKRFVGTIKADLCYIDSVDETGKIHNGYKVYSVNDVNQANLTKIIIGSRKYAKEMRTNLNKYMKQKIDIMDVPECLNCFI